MTNDIDYEYKKRIMFDLDGTICYTKKPDERYEDVLPIPGAVEQLRKLHKEGWYIIICTARNMRTHKHNLGQVTAKQTKIIVDWFHKWDIPFDELWHNKPHYSLAFDDKVRRFVSWEEVEQEIEKFEQEN